MTVVQAADLGNLDDLASLWRLDPPGLRCVLCQGQVRAAAVVVSEVLARDVSEVPFVEHDDAVEALTADASDQTFGVRVLPRRPRSDHDLFDSHGADSAYEVVTVDPVTIAEKESRRSIPRERFPD
jgi:hypothetical protein